MSESVKYRRGGAIGARPVVRGDGMLYANAYEAAGGFNVPGHAAKFITECCNRKKSHNTAYGYKWMWLDEWLCKELGLEG